MTVRENGIWDLKGKPNNEKWTLKIRSVEIPLLQLGLPLNPFSSSSGENGAATAKVKNPKSLTLNI